MTEGLKLYFQFISFLFGAVVGSFLNVCIHRMPREESIINPPSHCPGCNQPIRWSDNIPLLSYCLLRGKCRNCPTRISPRYVLVELLTGVLFLAILLKYGWHWTVPIYWLLVAGLITSTFIDFEHYIIPNEITYGGIIAGLVFSVVHPPLMGVETIGASVLRSFIGILVGGVSLLLIAMAGEKIFKKEAMGMGDVKFLAGIGAFLGWQATLFILFVSSVAGGVIGMALVLANNRGWQSRIPYGPYIALGALVWLFCGAEVVDWYLRFINFPVGGG